MDMYMHLGSSIVTKIPCIIYSSDLHVIFFHVTTCANKFAKALKCAIALSVHEYGAAAFIHSA
jgi:hypothetical protein